MKKIPFSSATEQKVFLDLDTLISSRLLLCANSGGGKSWAVRGLCERAGKHIPLIVLDPEGEFASLREQLDIVLVGRGKGVDIQANVKTAAELSLRLLELGTSAVIDIYELPRPERRAYVRRFLESLMGAPKRLWTSVLVVVDEAHDYAPEGAKSEAHDAVVSLMSQGRKRGFCGILATQRLSKLSKDAAAEANNVALGRTTLDVDLRRAGDLLGFGKGRWRELQELEPGEWYTYGPAFTHRGVLRSRALPVETSHPRPGSKRQAPPEPSSKVQAIVGQLEELARRDEGQVSDIEEARALIGQLQREIRKAPAIDTRQVEALEAQVEMLNDRCRGFEKAIQERDSALIAGADELGRIADRLRAARADAPPIAFDTLRPTYDECGVCRKKVCQCKKPEPIKVGRARCELRPPAGVTPLQEAAQSNGEYSGPESRVIEAARWWLSIGVEAPTRLQLATLAGYHERTKSFLNALGSLRSKGVFEDTRPVGLAPLEKPPTLDQWRQRVMQPLKTAERETIRLILQHEPISRDDLAAKLGVHVRTKSHLNRVGRLKNTFGFIEDTPQGLRTTSVLWGAGQGGRR